MATNSVGYDGSVDEIQWAGLARYLGAEFAVAGNSDWEVTAQSGATRTVKVAVGSGYGYGVLDTTTVQETIALDVVASGTRWDLIARRRDWQPAGGTTTLVKVNGSSSRVIPAGRLNTPGVICDQPLALVQISAGQTLPTAIIDLRTWPRKVTSAMDLLAMVNPRIGDEVVIADVRWRYQIDSTGTPAWAADRTRLNRLSLPVATSSAVISTLTGWTGSLMSNRSIVQGNLVHLDIEVRLIGARIPCDANGNLGDQQFATLVDPAIRPTQQIPMPFLYFGGPVGSPTAFSSVGGMGYLNTSGALYIVSGLPNQYINTRTTSVASVRAHLVYLREN